MLQTSIIKSDIQEAWTMSLLLLGSGKRAKIKFLEINFKDIL